VFPFSSAQVEPNERCRINPISAALSPNGIPCLADIRHPLAELCQTIAGLPEWMQTFLTGSTSMRKADRTSSQGAEGRKAQLDQPADKQRRNAAQPLDKAVRATEVDPTAADETDVLSDAELALDTRAKAE
jgi:hypothetical protein